MTPAKHIFSTCLATHHRERSDIADTFIQSYLHYLIIYVSLLQGPNRVVLGLEPGINTQHLNHQVTPVQHTQRISGPSAYVSSQTPIID